MKGRNVHLPANHLWRKIESEVSGKDHAETAAIMRGYLDDIPASWRGYQALRDRLVKRIGRTEAAGAGRSTRGSRDEFHVQKRGSARVCFVGAENCGKSALVSAFAGAPTEVNDFPQTTREPVAGLLRADGGDIQCVDTPALLPGTVDGAGSGRRLLHLISTGDAAVFVIDAGADAGSQARLIVDQLTAFGMHILQAAVRTEFTPQGRGGVSFAGAPIGKAEAATARRMLADAEAPHGRVTVRSEFCEEELAAQLAGKTLMPSVFVVTKDDLPAADAAEKDIRAAYPQHTVIRTNFLDEANFDGLRGAVVSALGLRKVTLLDAASPDGHGTPMLVPGGSDVRDLVDRTDGVDDSSIAAALIWGDSVKHPGQEVGLSHLVVEGDRVHFRS
ncbi:MAG: GTPase [Candidatus Poribacteria bacterium]